MLVPVLRCSFPHCFLTDDTSYSGMSPPGSPVSELLLRLLLLFRAGLGRGPDSNDGSGAQECSEMEQTVFPRTPFRNSTVGVRKD